MKLPRNVFYTDDFKIEALEIFNGLDQPKTLALVKSALNENDPALGKIIKLTTVKLEKEYFNASEVVAAHEKWQLKSQNGEAEPQLTAQSKKVEALGGLYKKWEEQYEASSITDGKTQKKPHMER